MTESDRPNHSRLDDVLQQQDADGLWRALDAGGDVNELTFWGSLLKRAILRFEGHPQLHRVVATLLARGADAKLLTRTVTGRCSRQ